MAKPVEQHWGRWIIARGRSIGFRFQRDLAEAVGVTPEHISRWARMAEPPTHMRSGHDDSLARALKIDRHTLFSWWNEIEPEDAPQIVVPPSKNVPWDAAHPEDDEMRARIADAMMNLGIDDLRTILSFILGIAQKRQAEFEAKLHESMKRLGVGPYSPAAMKKELDRIYAVAARPPLDSAKRRRPAD